MSVVISTPDQIAKSPLNTSTSKQLYSFPKARRFNSVDKATCPQAFYDLPPVKTKRTTGFGYGYKSDFTKGIPLTPAPDRYVLPSEFSPERAKEKGRTIGTGREALAGSMAVIGKDSPGPGAYPVNRNLGHISFSLRGRTNNSLFQDPTKAPGPGAYDHIPTIGRGKIFVSKYKNLGGSTISPSKISRTLEDPESRHIPGPGAYDPKLQLDPKGEYFVSRFRSSTGRSFSHEVRKSMAVKSGMCSFQKCQTHSNCCRCPGTWKLQTTLGFRTL
eukprot:TRINITY_DN8212_c0_g4_i1.p1 TRINITY_DN8212_c0_g4~~TRINITY_DN8212_c0_g4_i1.p1  ORF type:complete len:273 (+),score=-0.24 TRINITY_DN8212_c0_g4_i1:85-903(+)